MVVSISLPSSPGCSWRICKFAILDCIGVTTTHLFICILFLSFIMLLEEESLQNRGCLMNNNLINKINKIARLEIDDDELEKLISHHPLITHVIR